MAREDTGDREPASPDATGMPPDLLKGLGRKTDQNDKSLRRDPASGSGPVQHPIRDPASNRARIDTPITDPATPRPTRADAEPERFVPRLGRAHGGSSLILSHNADARARFQAEARLGGAIAVVPDPAQVQADWCVTHADQFDYCLIDEDFLGDPDATLDLCLRMKNRTGHLPIILLNDGSADSDVTAEAMALCDGRLAYTSTSGDFVRVVQSAILREGMRGMALNRPVPAGPQKAARPVVEADFADDASIAGWWILPTALFGAAGWVTILYALSIL